MSLFSNFFASEEARRAVHILLVANVSQSYFNQQLAYKQLRIARDTLSNYQQSYAFVEQQQKWTGRRGSSLAKKFWRSGSLMFFSLPKKVEFVAKRKSRVVLL